MKTLVKFAENGKRIGDSHPLAKLGDDEVDLVKALALEGLSYSVIAAKMGISKSQVGRIVRGEQRCHLVRLVRRCKERKKRR